MNPNLSCLTHSGFDIQTAVLLAHCAELAYEDDVTIISNWARLQGFDSPTSFNQGNIQGFWVTTTDIALLVFRGTSNLGQWVRDARLLPVSHPWGRVHKGFLDGVAQVEEDLGGFYKAASQTKHVWITGHSLGGALAVLAAARLVMQGIAPSVYTYGQPRIGLAGFRDRFDSELPRHLWRLINQSDIVARLPAGLLYRHCGQVKRIVNPGQLEVRGHTGSVPLELTDVDLPAMTEDEYKTLLDQLEANPGIAVLDAVDLEGRSAIFRDHSMLEYIRLLKDIRDLNE